MYLLCILHFTDARFSWTLKISPRFDNYSINLIWAAEIFQLMTRIFDEIVIYVLEDFSYVKRLYNIVSSLEY